MAESAVHYDNCAVRRDRRPGGLRSAVIPTPRRAARNNLMLVTAGHEEFALYAMAKEDEWQNDETY